MKEKFKNMDLRLTELAEYLNISRPTLYKFADYYATGDRKLINERTLKLFDYINSTVDITKKDVISYIMNNIVNETKDDFSNKIKKYAVDSQMQELILLILENKQFYHLYDTLAIFLRGDIDIRDLRNETGHLMLAIEKIKAHKKLTEKEKNTIEKLQGDTLYEKIFKNRKL